MKRLHLLIALVGILGLILTSCGPGGQAADTPTVVPPADEGPDTVPADSVSPTPPPTTIPTTVMPIDIAGPPMQVGSKFEHVDRSILVAVPAGEFTMGYGGQDNPQHTVSLSDFWIYQAKVTNRQFAWCVAAGICAPPDLTKNLAYTDPKRENDPVVGINWDQAQAYCSFVQGRLPTEAEWEKTARGPDGNIWPWGDQAPECSLLNFKFCIGTTTDVTKYPGGQSYYEALDMAGNAYEWVADWYSPKYYGESPAQDPLGPELGEKRSVRGSGFESGADQSISARRYSFKVIETSKDLGFRCVVEDPMYFAPACAQLAVYGKSAVSFLGGPSGQSVTNGCPVLDISQGQYCGVGDIPETIVTFNPPPPLGSIDPGGCAPTPADNQFLCKTMETVSISAACNVTLVGAPGCSAGYSYDPASNNCAYKAAGWKGQCLPGANFDPERQCCSASGGANFVNSFPLCPVGKYYDATLNACFDVPTAGMVSASETVGLKDCSGGQIPECDPATNPDCQPSTGGCPPPAGGCGRNPNGIQLNWNSTTCRCE